MRKQPSAQRPRLDKGVLKKILHALERQRLLLALSLLLALAVVSLTLYVPVLIGQAIDLITARGRCSLPASGQSSSRRGSSRA